MEALSKKTKMIAISMFLFAAACLALAAFCTGCDGTPDLPPCGPGTFEFQGVCLTNDGNNHEAFCGEGTHWDNNACDGNICGLCITDPNPPTKTLVCGEGTHERNGKCVTDQVTLPPPTKTCPFNGVLVGSGCSGWYGACAKNGVIECLPNGHSVCSTDIGGSQSQATVEICGDGIDNDCDGQTDEGCPCTVERNGVPSRGEWGSLESDLLKMVCMFAPQSESCNGLDDDGDGQVDEGCAPQNAQFVKAEVIVSPENSTTIIASYELTTPARVYYKFRYDLNSPWVVWSFAYAKEKKSSCAFGPIAPDTTVFWRMEAKNDDDKIVDTREGAVYTSPAK